ncbi:MAG: hypothetical protein AUJ92_06920 [Armatimonadetes bacterium CG2_30_59_28]|nr:hypothetical protein [Armatimonadota bacterium]OIO96036.1 MAG: hypothetical protein AUJ92_06920 [Armatimonadetes bacterium CG2_30_59_28]PIU62707.1 MAG: hypothetical protein COS85_17630 [Armatimonadetes bacterium CG07_land_8_20_14_0_80_59_28]PIX42432.1 MAG: hypothetical protein COZ56_09415 [Armatimonadetes bacterium CG_4_8_14_3_um_filter_58_9]PIY37864.1 MAG: hypothetical protein COZ05_21785 [Armatimonadetes bacterium CG_4_10_14_3_um_filter_59_10]PJB75059.1 MAG: hypothetical protein CO095_041
MDVVFETVDALGNGVVLNGNQWNQHIVRRHPEVAPYEHKLRETVETPDCVYISEVRDDTRIFYKRHAETGKFQRLFLKVVVAYDTEPGYVLTAYFCPNITGGKLLWIRTSL